MPLMAVVMAGGHDLTRTEEWRVAEAILRADLDQDRKFYEVKSVLKTLEATGSEL